MAQVNRIIYNSIPPDWAFDPVKGAFIRDLLDIIRQLKTRTGGNDDFVADQQTKELFPWLESNAEESNVSSLFNGAAAQPQETLPWFLQSLSAQPVEIVTVFANHTTAADEIVIANAVLTVSLNPEPGLNERVTVKRNTGAGIVTIDANGSTIDGAANYQQVINYESNTFLFTESGWLII